MTAKEYLSQAYKLDRKADMLRQKADALRKSVYIRNQNYENSGHRISSDGFNKILEEADDYDCKADEIADTLADIRSEIKNIINLISDSVQRDILEYRYLMYMRFESGYDKKTGKYEVGIDEKIGYCARHMYRHYNKALQEIDRILKNVSECQ